MTAPNGLVQMIARGDPFEAIQTALSRAQYAAATERGRRMTLGDAAALVSSIAEPFTQER